MKPGVIFGQEGLVKINCISRAKGIWFGHYTGRAYPFNSNTATRINWVDRRDVPGLLAMREPDGSPSFVEVPL